MVDAWADPLARERGGAMGKHFVSTVDIAVEPQTAFEGWKHFEDFPQFMSGVEEVTMIDEHASHWRVSIGGVEKEFDAEITAEVAGRMIAWRSVNGPWQSGTATFQALDPTAHVTRLTVEVETEPADLTERIGSALGFPGHLIKKDLTAFKTFVEQREYMT
jgi:uncharacterized membrane protein